MAGSNGAMTLPPGGAEKPKPKQRSGRANSRAAAVIAVAAVVAVAGFTVIWRLTRPPNAIPITGTPEPPTEQPETPSLPPQTALVRVYFPAWDDASQSRQQLNQLLPLLPLQIVEAPQGSPIIDVLRKHFTLPDGELGATLADIAQNTRTEQGTRTQGIMPAGGVLLVPAVPLNPRQEVFAISTESDTPDGRLRAAGTGVFYEGAAGRAATYEVSREGLRSEGMARLLASGYARVASYAIEINLSLPPCPGHAEPIMSAAEETLIARLSSQAARQVDLFVMDTGWPDQASQIASIGKLTDMLNDVRKTFDLPIVSIPRPPFASSHSHVRRIQESLQPFETLDVSKRVQVTYVPLTRAQGAGPLLRELLVHGELIKLRSAQGALARGGPAQEDEATARGFVDLTYPRLATGVGERPFTDKDLVEGLMRVAALVAENQKTRYFVNHSWVIKNGLIDLGITSGPRGISVVAAGNTGANVNKEGIDFAQRSANDKHFVTVMNLDEKGQRVCGTSYVSQSLLEGAGAVGFSGRLGTESHTSFATPRVAWLLALAEASQPESHVAAEEWVPLLDSRLKAIRTSDPDWARVRASPLQILNMWR